MSFPGTYNINYYYGDTLEFRIYPKNSSGEIFDLSSFTLSRFTLAPSRTSLESEKISCFASISTDRTNILCTIRTEDADKLDPNINYVYDVEISKDGSPYPIVYTLLTGTISITPDITKVFTNIVTEVPANPTQLTLDSVSSSTLKVFWTSPVSGGPVQFYRVAVIPFTTNSTTIQNAITSSTTLIAGGLNEYTFFDLQENTDYSIILRSNNSAGDANLDTILTNSTPFRTADNPFTIEPDFFVTNNGNTSYTINGESNPAITLVRGQTYVFNVNAPTYPFWIQLDPGAFDEDSIFSDGISNNGTEFGNIIFIVPEIAPDTLYYVAENQIQMSGVINIVDGES
jgi:hypothetical protein